MIIGVDVDQTVVDTLTEWNNYIKQISNNEFDIHTGDLVNYEEYWRSNTLYDGLTPVKDVINILTKLSKTHKIYFISKCYNEHIPSKENFLQRHFGFDYKFINIAEKWHIDVDIMIDDNEHILDNMECSGKFKIDLFNVKSNNHIITNWKNIPQLIKEIVNVRTK